MSSLTGHGHSSPFCQNGWDGRALLGQPSKGHPYRILILLSWSWAIFTVFRVFPILRRFVYICLLHKKSSCNTGGQSVKLCLLPLLRADFLFLQADFLFDVLHKTGSQSLKTGSQSVKTGSQSVKQEVTTFFQTDFLCYSLTSCIMGRCKQIFERSEKPEKL